MSAEDLHPSKSSTDARRARPFPFPFPFKNIRFMTMAKRTRRKSARPEFFIAMLHGAGRVQPADGCRRTGQRLSWTSKKALRAYGKACSSPRSPRRPQRQRLQSPRMGQNETYLKLVSADVAPPWDLLSRNLTDASSSFARDEMGSKCAPSSNRWTSPSRSPRPCSPYTSPSLKSTTTYEDSGWLKDGRWCRVAKILTRYLNKPIIVPDKKPPIKHIFDV